MAESDLSIPYREAQRADDMALLTGVRNDLPQGHRELPGLIRAIELLRVSLLEGHDVAFVAVASDALAGVRKAYEHNIAVRDVGPEPGGLTKMLTAHEALRDAVACLLGLEPAMSKSPKLKLYRLTWADTKAARHLKQAPHVIQVTVCGAFPSRAAFVRAMIESGLQRVKGSEAATARFMKVYADDARPVDDSDYFHQPEVEILVQNPGKIYVSSLNGPSREIPVPWPPTD